MNPEITPAAAGIAAARADAHRHPCGCALGWRYGDGQCATGAALAPQVQAALWAYQAEPYQTRAARLYGAWQALEKQLQAHFTVPPTR